MVTVEARSADWARAVSLLQSEFDETCLEDESVLLDECETGIARYIAWKDGAELAGICRYVSPAGADFAAIIHITVDPAHRGKGIARALVIQVRSEVGSRPILVETEPGPPMQFWEARGAEVISNSYVQPPLGPDLPPVPFTLMALHGEPLRDSAQLVTAFYGHFWKLDASHPYVVAALAGVRPRGAG